MSYNQKILNHFNLPKNVGELDENNDQVGSSLVGAPSCGDVLKFSIKIENNIIIDAKFLAFGCGAAIASSSLLTEKVIGKTLNEAEEISNQEIASELELPPIKYHCSVLAEEAIKDAIKDYKNKRIKS
ncbi:iron-sulfur cluster assembly scaffold protein [Alphaproteobacteria bacterium endosymbiont of Tiliacea citrago]|uniref:iron-sulfur cluster assembly scaffold protein n=1 Tax=Alphaproteobacteria bacterium endosymbiont of Tiliacea citrago TaxID=3077944 RepID=UPI00313CC4D7